MRGGRGRRWRGRLEGEGRNIGENREGGKEGEISPRDTCADPRREEGDKGWEGRQGVGGGERPTLCPTLANKNQIHQEYSGLRKGIHL